MHAPLSHQRIEIEPGVFLAVDVSGSSDGVPIVFSSSLAADHGMWRDVISRLPAYCRCIRYDARGHGRSSAPATGWTLARLGQDILAVMDACNIQRATICGLSLGGLTAMWLARHAPGRVASLVLANTAANFPPPSMWEERAAGARASGVAQFVTPTLGRWFTPRFRAECPDRVADIAAAIGETSPEGYAGCCRILADSDVSADLSEIDSPTLVIVGEHDASTPPARGLELQSAIKGSGLVRLDAAHMSAVEAAAPFAEALEKHLQKIK